MLDLSTSTRRLVLGLAAAGLALSLVAATPSTAEACTCLPPDIARSYNNADDVVRAKVGGKLGFAPAGKVWYWARVQDTFKGCLQPGKFILIESNNSSAACGISLSKGSYLLNGQDAGNFWGLPIIGANSCDYNQQWKQLSKEDLGYLYSRYNCCGDTCECTDGSQPVNCFVDPCQVSSCDVKGATCTANYCGGCNAEWTDATGAEVCQPGCDYDGVHYDIGETFPAGDGCNTCTCTANGVPACTKIACPVGEPCGDNFCGEGTYCCNASCGICAPEGGACIQIACLPTE